MTRSKVDLPAPFGPTIAVQPAATSSVTVAQRTRAAERDVGAFDAQRRHGVRPRRSSQIR